MAHDHFLPSQKKAASGIGALKRFLSERQLVSEGNRLLPTSVEVEVERFGAYLRETRGAAEMTIACRGGQDPSDAATAPDRRDGQRAH